MPTQFPILKRPTREDVIHADVNQMSLYLARLVYHPSPSLSVNNMLGTVPLPSYSIALCCNKYVVRSVADV
ncbi:hypothetical protein PILCRDRAFT_811936 [Piloderma croceum F 1598]|uniref:Uncharacterized protein n=1 Tax=Piloderma croceum (strain F 1598) TaxID=765440 RepID=A0A0C3GEV1_PILCF|nr:hypothetical protein PILCRDRAFT_811936 [Piloderma croceum F 1598]